MLEHIKILCLWLQWRWVSKKILKGLEEIDWFRDRHKFFFFLLVLFFSTIRRFVTGERGLTTSLRDRNVWHNRILTG
jgi:hypothetical protein